MHPGYDHFPTWTGRDWRFLLCPHEAPLRWGDYRELHLGLEYGKPGQQGRARIAGFPQKSSTFWNSPIEISKSKHFSLYFSLLLGKDMVLNRLNTAYGNRLIIPSNGSLSLYTWHFIGTFSSSHAFANTAINKKKSDAAWMITGPQILSDFIIR